MGREARTVDPNGGIYHIYNRGNNKSDIFRTDEDKNVFKSIVLKTMKLIPFSIYHYVIMSNHFHIMLKIEKGEDLQIIMKSIGEKYAIYRHIHDKTSGHVWQGRYGSKAIDNDENYFMHNAVYIENNPVRAKMVSHANEYKWSSYHHYAEGKIDQLVTTDPLYEAISNDKVKRMNVYKSYFSA